MALMALRTGQPISEIMDAPPDVLRAMTAVMEEDDQRKGS